MSEGNEAKKPVTFFKQPVIVLCLLIVILTAGMAASIFYIDYLRTILESKTSKIADYAQLTKDLSTNLEVKSSAYAEMEAEFETLNKRLEGIKDQDDLLRRDIELYIDQKFKLIPKVLCKDIAMNIVKYSKEQDVSPELVVGIIQVESAFNPSAISKKGARGLMQLMPEWAKKFGLKDVDDLHDVDVNILNGIKVLKIHIKDDGKGNVTKGLYYYVGKDNTYADNVYKAMGRFVSFRYTVDDGEQSNGEDLPEEGVEPVEPTPTNSDPASTGRLESDAVRRLAKQ